MSEICGIYKITSPSGKIYIGQSKNIKNRLKKYKSLSINKQPKIERSIKKYGWDNHNFEIIEECLLDDLNNRERYWQDFYNVLGENGLNCVLTRSEEKIFEMSDETKKKIAYYNSNFKTYSEETRRKISESKLGVKRDSSTWDRKYIHNKVYEYNKLGVFVKEWDSLMKVSEYYKVKLTSISSNLYDKSYNKKYFFFLTREKISNVKPYKNLKSIPIEQYTKDNIFIREWESINDATEFLKLKSASSISNALNGRSKMSGGFIWRYKKKS